MTQTLPDYPSSIWYRPLIFEGPALNTCKFSGSYDTSNEVSRMLDVLSGSKTNRKQNELSYYVSNS